jgi:hypothetical protein
LLRRWLPRGAFFKPGDLPVRLRKPLIRLSDLFERFRERCESDIW